MNYNELNKKHRLFEQLISKRRILDALHMLEQLIRYTEKNYFIVQLEKHKETYSNILKYSFSGIDDPERKKIYNHLLVSVLQLGDQVKENILTDISDAQTYRTKWKLTYDTSRETDHELKEEGDLSFEKSLENFKSLVTQTHSDSEQESPELDQKREEIFKLLWLADFYSESEKEAIQNFNADSSISWVHKSVLLSGITLSLLRCFDPQKFILLFDLYREGETQVWQRALVGLLLMIYMYDDRLELYPEIQNRLSTLQDEGSHEKNIEAVILQLIRSKETKKITRKWEEEILPEMLKVAPKIREKLDLDNIFNDPGFEDKNPDWENFFQETPDLMDKLQEFSKMQMEGSDVFLSAFSRLKQFPFFNQISHWFLPFYQHYKEVAEVADNEQQPGSNKFLDALENSAFMCNSDKYSFIFNIKHIPSAHKEQMMQMMNSEISQMGEISEEDQMLDSFNQTKGIITQYIQDLYRFFKLYPRKDEFRDIFEEKLDIHNTRQFNKIVNSNKILRNVAEFYFQKNYFEEALDVYNPLLKEITDDGELYEKAGYCYQMQKQYQHALTYYKKAELFDKNKSWVLRKIALCYRYLNQHEEALTYYHQAEQIEPDNLHIQAFIGHTCLEMQKYEEALKYYFKVEYLAPENVKIRRPIAWCSFALGKFDTALNYYQKILAQQENLFDYVGFAHVNWCKGETEKAIESYYSAFKLSNLDFKEFRKAFEDDREMLIKHGIDSFDIPIMLDYIKSLKADEGKG